MAFPDAPISFLDKNTNDLIQASHINDIQNEIELIETVLLTGGLPALTTAWPVGSVFLSVVPTNPATLLGFGVWSAFGAGRMLVGLDPAQAEFDVVEETGGSKTHTLSAAEMPSHTHLQDAHTHTQNAHNHGQDAHNHAQDAHGHAISDPGHGHTVHTNSAGGGTLSLSEEFAGGTRTNPPIQAAATGVTVVANTATNQAAVATNQAATATNQPVTATNQTAGGGIAHNNMPPYIVVYMWKRVV